MLNPEQQTRLECLCYASHAAGEDSPFEYVLDGANEFYEFVMKGMTNEAAVTGVVVPFKPDDGAA